MSGRYVTKETYKYDKRDLQTETSTTQDLYMSQKRCTYMTKETQQTDTTITRDLNMSQKKPKYM